MNLLQKITNENYLFLENYKIEAKILKSKKENLGTLIWLSQC